MKNRNKNISKVARAYRRIPVLGRRGNWRLKQVLRKRLAEPFEPLEVSHRGLRWWITDLQNNTESSLFWGEPYDEPVTRQIDREVERGHVTLDIGANIGYFSVLMGVRVGERGHVYAFEPSERHQKVLFKNLALNGLENVTVERLALGEEPGTIVHSSTASSGSVLPNYDEYTRHEVWTAKVPMDTLDRWVERRQLSRLDYIKMDVDGNEFEVLKGGKATLQQFQPRLMLEVWEEGLQSLGYSLAEFLTFLADLGYSFWLESRWTDEVEEAMQTIRRADTYYDLFCKVLTP